MANRALLLGLAVLATGLLGPAAVTRAETSTPDADRPHVSPADDAIKTLPDGILHSDAASSESGDSDAGSTETDTGDGSSDETASTTVDTPIEQEPEAAATETPATTESGAVPTEQSIQTDSGSTSNASADTSASSQTLNYSAAKSSKKTVAIGRVRVRKSGRARVQLSCSAGVITVCAGSLSVRNSSTGKLLGKTRFRIVSERDVWVDVTLNRSELSKLGDRGRVRVSIKA